MTGGEIEALYARAGPIVLRRCLQMLGREEAALDATQWTFLRALEGSFEPRSPGESLAWLYRTATRRCLTVLRDERRRRDLRVVHHHDLVPEHLDVEGEAMSRDLVEQALASVDERTAEVALLTVFQELPVARAAEVLDVSERTVLRERKTFAQAVRDLLEAT
ncbi:MAG: sigma-70 family RNA polymerase sigma factor [Alphaproteobacteria bacterium]|nr:sigma-70 family RNA polymerase sigma factor [Alphaproteobacteria bacterium]